MTSSSPVTEAGSWTSSSVNEVIWRSSVNRSSRAAALVCPSAAWLSTSVVPSRALPSSVSSSWRMTDGMCALPHLRQLVAAVVDVPGQEVEHGRDERYPLDPGGVYVGGPFRCGYGRQRAADVLLEHALDVLLVELEPGGGAPRRIELDGERPSLVLQGRAIRERADGVVADELVRGSEPVIKHALRVHKLAQRLAEHLVVGTDQVPVKGLGRIQDGHRVRVVVDRRRDPWSGSCLSQGELDVGRLRLRASPGAEKALPGGVPA